MISLDEIRKTINDIDTQLLTLLAKRRAVSIEVAKTKLVNQRAVRDHRREQELLAYLTQIGSSQGLSAHYIERLFQLIIEDSVLLQQDYIQQQLNPESVAEHNSIAYLGPLGSYSSLAARKFLGRQVTPSREVSCSSFQQVLREVDEGRCHYGVLPIENMTSGSINDVYDLMQQTDLSIVAELSYPIDHCVLTAMHTSIEEIEVIYTHPQPFVQSSHYFDQHPHIRKEVCDSTSAAMLKVKELNSPHAAAIGSEEGGALYSLVKLAGGIGNQPGNCTRFWVVAKKPVLVSPQIPAKTTFILSTTQKAGSLVEVLLVLQHHNINMTKLESRPIPGNPWEEMFYIDAAVNLTSEPMQAALKELQASTRYLKILGCYPSEDVRPTQSPAAE